MRIITGELKGRRFDPPLKKWPTRPTTDRAKEALFNILENTYEFTDLDFLDLFGGTGNIAMEALSRGVNHAVWVDSYVPASRFVTKTCEDFGLSDRIDIICSDIHRFMAANTRKFDMIFADPPYKYSKMASLPDEIFESEILTKYGVFILEHDITNEFKSHANFQEVRKYGDTFFSFFEPIN